MDIKKNNFMEDIYTSYGPFVGKVCENTNTQLYKDNIIESITSSISESSINKNSLKQKSINLLVPDNPKNNYIYSKKSGGVLSETKSQSQSQSQLNNNIEEETSNFFNYKVSIFSYKISIWILILILLIVICIGYFIYKYLYLKNTNIITYKKNLSNELSDSDIYGREIKINNKNTDLTTENSTSGYLSSDSSNSSNNS